MKSMWSQAVAAVVAGLMILGAAAFVIAVPMIGIPAVIVGAYFWGRSIGRDEEERVRSGSPWGPQDDDWDDWGEPDK